MLGCEVLILMCVHIFRQAAVCSRTLFFDFQVNKLPGRGSKKNARQVGRRAEEVKKKAIWPHHLVNTFLP